MNVLTPDSLPPALRHAIAIRTLAPGQFLFRQGDAASALFIVKSGRLKIARHSPERRFVTLHVVRSGDSFAEAALFSEFYAYTAIAEIASQVIVYPKQALLSAMREKQSLAEDYMTLLVKRNLSLIIRLELRDMQSAHRRVLQYLHYLTQANHSSVVTFDRPFKEIATDLGLTPATLSRSLNRLEREGLIIRNQKMIQLNHSSVA